MDKFLCPNCTHRIDYLKTDIGYLWLCKKCNGQLVSSANIKASLPDDRWKELMQRALHRSEPNEKKCPRCRAAMFEFDAAEKRRLSPFFSLSPVSSLPIIETMGSETAYAGPYPC